MAAPIQNPVASKVAKYAGWVLVALVALYGVANVIVQSAVQHSIGIPVWVPVVVGALAGCVKLTRVFVQTIQTPSAGEGMGVIGILLLGMLAAVSPETVAPLPNQHASEVESAVQQKQLSELLVIDTDAQANDDTE